MGPVKFFLLVYIVGGVTFVPLILLVLLAVAYYTFPDVGQQPLKKRLDDPADLVRDGDLTDQKLVFKTGTDSLAEKFHRKHDSDVATGYFAVCREYVPGGVNGKPPEKISPAGEVVAQESPSVYQSMYRSIFDRSHKPTIEPNKDGAGKSVKRANNVFFVVLRHGHLMLYDDLQQLEVRYVISLEYHDVDIYGGEEEEIPEAELWMKRNAIRLQRRAAPVGDKATSLPFFFFSENLSEKEDFYHAILANQEKKMENPPIPQDFDMQHIITLVQKLHSSEEHLQTRWLNAMLGRLFLAMYRTPFVEQLIRKKLTKKMARVKKPNFITKLALQKIDTGNGAPFFTNLRLRDLTVNGECVIESDVDYTGRFRVEIAATARIELGSRFKAREVDMVLAATCKSLSGHMLFKLKPSPSNRLWFTFEKMPKIEMSLEPIVSSRQITYGFILKAMESRILEVFAEALVLPFWDDMPFLDTIGEHFRGGIWKKDPAPTTSTEIKDESPEDVADIGIEGSKSTIAMMKKEDRNMSMPVLSDTSKSAAVRAAKKSISSLKDVTGTSPEKTPDRMKRPEPPRALRSSSFASAADPTLSPTHVGSETLAWDIKDAQKRDSVLKDLSLRSLGSSPDGSNAGSLPNDSMLSAAVKTEVSGDGVTNPLSAKKAKPDPDRRRSSESQTTISSDKPSSIFSMPPRTDTLDTSTSRSSSRSRASTHEGHPQRSSAKSFADTAKSLTSNDRKQALAASAMSAAQAAQKWGWGVIARTRPREGDTVQSRDSVPPSPPTQPMGRGRPLPPPGQPLPQPEKPGFFNMAKRKPVPASASPQVPGQSPTPDIGVTSEPESRKPSPKAVPGAAEKLERRRRQASLISDVSQGQDDELLVVEAPAESNPGSPSNDNEHLDDFFGHGETNSAAEDQRIGHHGIPAPAETHGVAGTPSPPADH